MRPDGIFRVETPADLTRAVAAAERTGAVGMPYLCRQLAAGRICLNMLLPDTRAPQLKAFIRATPPRPTVILIGDDDYQDRGPDAWPQAGRVARWAQSVLVHAAGARPEHYEAACVAAELVRRVAVVECSSRTAQAWVALFRSQPHAPTITLIPPAGGVHPLPLDRSAMQ